MKLSSPDLLHRLGSGTKISDLCTAAGVTRAEFDAWWKKEAAARVPTPATALKVPRSGGTARIERNSLGIPTISARTDEDLFFAFGYAMAEDRLFQLDYLRRRGAGRLCEILGPSQMELDLTARTIGLAQIAEREWQQLGDETKRLIQSFSDGVNALIEASRGRWPIEFDLLGYEPEPWRPQDSLVIEGEFRWYLTGRFPVICIPELAKRVLGGDGPLYRAFLEAEADEECILPLGSYVPREGGAREGEAPAEPHPTGGGNNTEGHGSNNWVLSGALTTTGKPIVCSDPHIAITAVSCWYEVALRGGSFNTVGIAYAGMPAVMFGRTPRVAWGITNNICSLRDLYQERTDPAHPSSFLYDNRWEPVHERQEVIHVKGQEPVTKTIRGSRNGPIVDEILPAPARATAPVSCRWQGTEFCSWLTSLHNIDRAKSVGDVHEAIRGWLVPTFCLVFADVDGHIGYRATGELPLRRRWERAYRQGWNPDHAWAGRIPYDGMPHVTDPPQGYVVTANNRVAADDYPYPLSGTWSSGYRGERIRQMIGERPQHSVQDNMQMHQDALSLRAVRCVPHILRELWGDADPRIQQALAYLAGWDCRMELDRVGGALFNTFFNHWSRAAADERFPADQAALIAPSIGGLACALLEKDAAGWFTKRNRSAVLHEAFVKTLDYLAEKLGPDMVGWNWGRLHRLAQKHVLSGIGDLGELLDRIGPPVKGDGLTVCNSGFDPNQLAVMGAGYRLVADLSRADAALHAVDVGAESGHPGSPHYDDQVQTWITGRYHELRLDGSSQAP